ncbi:MAG: DinB family protein [Gemmatimonadota bacterium]
MFLRSNYLTKIERCLDALSEDDVWWRPNNGSNSIGNLTLHLDGSTRAWILGVAGGRRVVRDRDAEFAERGPLAKASLLARLRATVAEADEVLTMLNEATLLERRPSNQGEVTVLWAVLHAVEHFAMHTGQIIMLTKLRTGSVLRLSD